MIKEINGIKLHLYGIMLIAVALGAYAQDIAYFLHNSLAIPLMVGLSTATIFSILLFLSPPILISKFNKNGKAGKKAFNIYFGINALTGVMASLWSLFVLIMWWG